MYTTALCMGYNILCWRRTYIIHGHAKKLYSNSIHQKKIYAHAYTMPGITWIHGYWYISRERCHQRKRYWDTRPDMKSGRKIEIDIGQIYLTSSSHHTAFCMQYAGRHEHSTVTLNSYDSRYIQYKSTRMSILYYRARTQHYYYANNIDRCVHACLSLSLTYCQMIDTHS